MTHETLFDPIRKKEVPATPEEHVRQATVRYLVDVVKVPEHLIAVEFPLSSIDVKTSDRVDILVHNFRAGAPLNKPWLLVECKAPSVKLTMNVIDQVIRYNYVLDVPYILITNGELFYLCKRDAQGDYLQQSRMPSFDELCQE